MKSLGRHNIQNSHSGVWKIVSSCVTLFACIIIAWYISYMNDNTTLGWHTKSCNITFSIASTQCFPRDYNIVTLPAIIGPCSDKVSCALFMNYRQQWSLNSTQLLKLPLCTSWPKATWSSCWLAEMFLTYQSLTTCYISSSSAKGKTVIKDLLKQISLSVESVGDMITFSFCLALPSWAYNLNNCPGLFAILSLPNHFQK